MIAANIHSFRLFVLYGILLTLCMSLELKPVRPGHDRIRSGKIEKRDMTNLDLRNFETFLWEAEDGPELVVGNFTVHTLNDNEHILSMEKFDSMLKSIDCASTGMTLTFIDHETFIYAQKFWDWVNGADDHAFIMVVGAGQCRINPHRVPYLVSFIHYDEEHNIARLTARSDEWKNLVQSYELRVGSIPMPAERRLLRRTYSTAFGILKDIPFTVNVGVGALSGSIGCADCGLFGSLKVEIDIKKGFGFIDHAIFRLQPQDVKFQAHPTIQLSAQNKISPEPWDIPVIPSPIPLYAITLHDILDLGAFTDLRAGIQVTTFKGSMIFSTGATVTIPNSAFLEIDFTELDKGPKTSSWTPSIDMAPLRVEGSAGVNLQLYLMPEVELKASVLSFGWKAALDLKAPTVNIMAAVKVDDAGGVCHDPRTVTGIEIETALGMQLRFVAGKVKGKEPIEFTIATVPLLKGPGTCIPLSKLSTPPKAKPTTTKSPLFIGPTQKKTTSPPFIGPTQVTPPFIGPTAPSASTSTPTCAVNSGEDGVCISTEACNNLGGNSEAGHCAGPKDIQCCTIPIGSGDICNIDKTFGTCLPTGSCSDSTGRSVPGHCPRGGNDIQCCISKAAAQDQNPDAPNGVGDTCSVDGVTGTCMKTSNCPASTARSVPGHCRGPTDVQCCVNKEQKTKGPEGVGDTCQANGIGGTCLLTSNCPAESAESVAGRCRGPASVQCCVTKTRPPTPGSGVPCEANGVAGTCKLLSECLGATSQSVPGHCPGAANVQCCITKKKPEKAPEAGDGTTCHANGITGTCMPVSKCPSSTAESVPGHCPGGNNIQCCVVKKKAQGEKSPTRGDKKLCTIEKSGLKNSGFNGECISTGMCKDLGGISTPGFCPGTGKSMQCCTYGTCKNKVAGVCEPVISCTGTTTPGLCGGGSNIQCCHRAIPPHLTGDENIGKYVMEAFN